MDTPSFFPFETPLGASAIAWGERGILAVRFPDPDGRAVRASLLARYPGIRESAPPPAVRRAIDGILELLEGGSPHLREVELDMEAVPRFHRRVYEAARAIPVGETVSYGELAARIGAPGAARAVGQALANNPFALVVPCHRILTSSGRLGGFSASGGVMTKLRLLAQERASVRAGELAFDPAEAERHLRSIPAMAALIEAVGPFRPKLRPADDLFDALAHSIVHQQLSGRAALAIYTRLAALFPHGHRGLDPRRLLRTSTEKLRGVGLSAGKIAALRDLAEKVVAKELPGFDELRAMDDETIIERLTSVRGIGRWTAEMLLLFRLGRPDVWPVDDLGVRKGYALAFGTDTLPTPQELRALGEPFRPYRSAAAWYFWRAVDLQGAVRAA